MFFGNVTGGYRGKRESQQNEKHWSRRLNGNLSYTADKPGAWFGFIGGVLGIFGAVILACDKGALTLTLSAFDKLPEREFVQIYPALRVLQERAGMLAIVWLLPLLSIGALIQAIGLLKSKAVPAWQPIMIIIGMIIMLNPDIEILSTFAAIFTAIGFIPIGVQVMRKSL